MKQEFLPGLVCASMALILFPIIANACSVCLTGADDPTTDAFNASVLFLMAAPYLVVGSIVGGLVYTFRRAAAKRAQSDTPEPPIHLVVSQKESGR